VRFGGPDRPAGARELLPEHVVAAPPDSVIDWATYYFRERLLIQALTQALGRRVHRVGYGWPPEVRGSAADRS